MKVLLLIIHQETDEYAKMYKVLSSHYARYKELDTFFIVQSPDLTTHYRIEGDKIYIKGTESFIPGILQKTIEAMIIAKAENYDFVIRSNSSTVINYSRLELFIQKAKEANIDCFTGYRQVLQWIRPSDGIVDEKYFGTVFASGAMFVLSRNAVKELIRFRHLIDFTVIDDVAIGIFFNRISQFPIVQIDPKYFIFNNKNLDFKSKKEWLTKVQRSFNPVAWRNKSQNRLEDVKCMAWIVDLINDEI